MAEHLLTDYRETWKPIPFNPEIEASEFGHLRRVSDGKIIGQHLDQHGYPTAVIGANRQRIRSSIGICAAFHGPKPSPGHYALHNNGIRSDNRAFNLRWGTQRENRADMIRHGTVLRGVDNPSAKLNPEKVREIRRLCKGPGRKAGGMRQRDVAALLGVSQQAVWQVVNGRTWIHVT